MIQCAAAFSFSSIENGSVFQMKRTFQDFK